MKSDFADKVLLDKQGRFLEKKLIEFSIDEVSESNVSSAKPQSVTFMNDRDNYGSSLSIGEYHQADGMNPFGL